MNDLKRNLCICHFKSSEEVFILNACDTVSKWETENRELCRDRVIPKSSLPPSLPNWTLFLSQSFKWTDAPTYSGYTCVMLIFVVKLRSWMVCLCFEWPLVLSPSNFILQCYQWLQGLNSFPPASSYINGFTSISRSITSWSARWKKDKFANI